MSLGGCADRQIGGWVLALLVAIALPHAYAQPATDTARIGLSKKVFETIRNPDGTCSVGYAIRVQNVGTEKLLDVQVVDHLAAELAPAEVLGVRNLGRAGGLREVNPAFDGVNDVNLLPPGTFLTIHREGWITFTVDIDPRGPSDIFYNQTRGEGTGQQSNVRVDDLSTDGPDPDPETPGEKAEDNPQPGDNAERTPVECPPTGTDPVPAIGASKRLVEQRQIAPATYQLTLQTTVQNLSEEVPLTDVGLVDDLSEAFAGAETVAVIGNVAVVEGDLLANPGFDGTTDTRLLAAGQSLAPGQHATLEFHVNITVDGAGMFSNQIIANGDSAFGPTTDLSDDGIETDPNGNGRANDEGEDDPTPIEVAPMRLGLAKVLTAVRRVGPQTFEVDFRLTVDNLSATLPVHAVQVTDDLAAAFEREGTRIESVSAVLVTGGLDTANANFNGTTVTELLSGTQTLAPGGRALVSFTVKVVSAGGEFFNQAQVLGGQEEEGTPLTMDLSDDGEVPDSNGNGQASEPGEDDPTPIVLEVDAIGVIAAAKEAFGIEVVAEDDARVSFRVRVANIGAAPLAEVQISEDLSAGFPAPASAALVGPIIVVQGPLTEVNANFDGLTDFNLLDGTQGLAAGETAVFEYTVSVVRNGINEFENQVTATGSREDGGRSFDLSDNGTDPDPNGNGDPSEPGEDDPTPVVFPAAPALAALVGTVFLDADFDGQFDTGEPGEADWLVELIDAQGSRVASATTGDDGRYAFGELPAGDYTVRFVNPSGVVWGEASAMLAEGETAERNFPVVAGGVVYNALSRSPVAGAVVHLTDIQGPLPDECLADGQQGQSTGEDGEYRLDLQPGTHPRCPSLTMTYTVELEVDPARYRFPSQRIPVQNSALDVSLCAVDPTTGPPCVVQPQAAAPAVGMQTTYFLDWVMGGDATAVANNHIPLDPRSEVPVPEIVVTKAADRDTAVIGDLVGYRVTARNISPRELFNLDFVDNIPASFTLVEGSQQLFQAGADGELFTGDDVELPVVATGTDPVRLGSVALPIGASVGLTYMTRVNAGAVPGPQINTVTPFVGNVAVGNSAQATVEIVDDPLLANTTIIGKVFHDENGDGWQDPDEDEGVPGVRLATVGGLIVETDAHGRYHIADVEVPRSERGTNFILKLDDTTLPPGSEVLSENPRVVRLTQALASKINFGVRLPPKYEVGSETTYQLVRTVVADDVIEPVYFVSGRAEITQDYLDRLQGVLAQYECKEEVTLRFTGHTDIDPLSDRLVEQHTNNCGLSKARAEFVRDKVVSALGGTSDNGGGTLDSVPDVVGMGEFEPAQCGAAVSHDPCADNDSNERVTDPAVVQCNISAAQKDANRRVEIAVVYKDSGVVESCVVAGIKPVDPPLPPPVNRYKTKKWQKLNTHIRFAFGSSVMDLDSQEKQALDTELAYYKQLGQIRIGENDKPQGVLQARVSGHTDPVKYTLGASGNNTQLSEDRADAVAKYLSQELGLDVDSIYTEFKGDTELLPRLENESEEDYHARLRRVEIELTYRVKIGQAQTSFAYEPLGDPTGVRGRVWMTQDALAAGPRLDVLALHDIPVNAAGLMADPVEFAAYTNYQAHIEHYDLLLYREDDTDLLDPIAELKSNRLAYPNAFVWKDTVHTYQPGQRLAYVLRVRRGDLYDETAPRLVNVVSEERSSSTGVAPSNVWDGDNLAERSRLAEGSVVRVHGEAFDGAQVVVIDNVEVPVDPKGRFAYEQFLPAGQRTVEVMSASGTRLAEPIEVDVKKNHAFWVGLANLTVGDHSVSGNFEPLSADDHFDESVYVDGRLAFYAKAKIQGKYLITAQLDSTEDELKNFGDNLERKDPRRLFRQLDPDRYYPVYGDDSTTVSDVDTQGAFYVRVDWDHNQALWGNYNTGMTDTEFMQYNRTLYGAKFAHKSKAVTEHGDAKRALTAFGSEAQSASAHVTFGATGGSLYYLRHTDIVQGSEKVWIEVRQRDTEQVVERQDLVEGADYEIDAIQGRIILRHPLSQVVNDRGPSIIRSRGLEGDDVYLLVDYEYVPDAFAAEDATYGVRAKGWLGDHVGVGVSKIVDERSGNDFDLEGIDVTLKASNGTYLSAEVVQSEARQNGANFASPDGGLSFASQNSVLPDALQEGDARAFEGRINFEDMSETIEGDVRAWWKEQDAGFSAGRLRQGMEVTEKGFDLVLEPTATVKITGGYAELEEDGIRHNKVARLQADVELNRVTLGGELRHEDLERTVLGTTQKGDGLMAGVRLGYALNDQQTVYASVQQGLNEDGQYRDNDLYAVGINSQVNEYTAVSVEVADGDRGEALTGGVQYSPDDNSSFGLSSGVGPGAISQFSGNYRLAEGHELYGSYAVDPDRTFGERNLLTFGQRRDFGNRFGIFTESQFGKDDTYGGVSHAFGLDYTTDQEWVLSALLQAAEDDSGPTDLERSAVSFGASVTREMYKFSAKLEYREDDSPLRASEQYLLSSSYTHKVNEARRWLGQLNVAWTDDDINGGRDGRFVEFNVGQALRPFDNDRWNVLAKYGYFYDLVSEGQSATRPDQQVHILSAEALYAFNARWELGGKIALKEGRVRMFRDSGSWEDYGVGLGVLRARYHLTHEWDALAEYRYLNDRHGESDRHGTLLGVYRHVGEHFKVGVGYNFTDFSDDIRDAEYDQHGWFIDLIGKF